MAVPDTWVQGGLCTVNPTLPSPKPAHLTPYQGWGKPAQCLQQLLLPGSVRVRLLLWFSEGSEEATQCGGVSCAVLCCAASLCLQLLCLKIPTGVIFYILQSLPQAVHLTLKWSYFFNCWQSIIIRHKPAVSALCGSAESSVSPPHPADRQV